jgi:hypothetical protein
MRAMALAVAALAAACSPPAQDGTDVSSTENVEVNAIACATSDDQCTPRAALTPVVGESIGHPVSLQVETFNTEGDWGWIIAQPWTPEGTQIDWSQTRYAERAAQGVLDGGGTTYALLKRENGRWRVVDFAVGPTDVAWADWPERHGAPASLMQTN